MHCIYTACSVSPYFNNIIKVCPSISEQLVLTYICISIQNILRSFCSLSTAHLASAVLHISIYLSDITALSLPVTLWFHTENSNLFNKRVFLMCFHERIPSCNLNDVQIPLNSLPSVQMILQGIKQNTCLPSDNPSKGHSSHLLG